MYDLDGIRIGDTNYDRVCLNCRYWAANTQLWSAANGMLCIKGHGHTNPNDSCSLFSPNFTDDVQNPNRFNEKNHKMTAWKTNR